MKTSIASLQERLIDWTPVDKAIYEFGACLGLWPEAGAPPGEDPLHGLGLFIKSHSRLLEVVLDEMSDAYILDYKYIDDVLFYRFNPNYSIMISNSIKKQTLKAFI